MTVHEAIGDDLAAFGGFLRCESCGHRRVLGDVAGKLRDGWPKHCGYTMRWWTARQVRDGEVPESEFGRTKEETPRLPGDR